ncbi:hypothetical protein [Clostridium kluyveri]|nr:hypothetical protein [Clostridium kluyveri]
MDLSKGECSIKELKNICPTNISIDKIESICAKKMMKVPFTLKTIIQI